MQNRTDGTIAVFGQTLVGPIRMRVVRLATVDNEELLPQGARHVTRLGSSSCDMDGDFESVFGDCGGRGVKVITTTSGPISDKALTYVQRDYILGGFLSEVQAALGSLDVRDVIPIGTGQVRFDMSLYVPDGDLFAGVTLEAGIAAAGVADGSVETSVDAITCRLFHPRFPPSLAFELVVGFIIAVQVRSVCVPAACVRYVSPAHACRSWLSSGVSLEPPTASQSR